MSRFYKLDKDKTPIPCDLSELQDMYDNPELRQIGFDIVDGKEVSTVFLEINHATRDEPPMLFETMIFDYYGNSMHMQRYHTWHEAVKGHAEAVKWAKDGCKDD